MRPRRTHDFAPRKNTSQEVRWRGRWEPARRGANGTIKSDRFLVRGSWSGSPRSLVPEPRGHRVRDGGQAGCLLLHGFTGTPLEMTPLADALADEGWTVSVAQLAGHGTSPADLARTRWSDWVASAHDAYRELQGRCRRIAIIGLSMGGALGLYLAASESPAAIVAISTPIRVPPLLAALSRFTSRVMPFAPVVFRLGPREPAVQSYRSTYSHIPLAATEQLVQLFDATRQTLPTLHVPILVVQGRRDWVIPRGSGREIVALAHGAPAQLLWLPRSGHLATLDRDRGVLIDHVKRFLHRHLADPTAKGVAAHRAPD